MLTLPLCIPYINQNQVQRINSVVSIFSSAGGKSLHLTTVHCSCKDMWSLRGKEFFFSSRWDWSPHLPYLTATLPVQPSNQLGLNLFKLEFFQVVLMGGGRVGGGGGWSIWKSGGPKMHNLPSYVGINSADPAQSIS